MKNFINVLFLSVLLVSPAVANDVLDDIKDAVEEDDRPGAHGRENAENAKKNNPGKGKKDNDDSLWNKIEDEIDDDESKKGKGKEKNKKK